MNFLRRFSEVPLHIEEDHHHVLTHILKAVGSKRISLEKNILVHFDSHPDLLLPRNLTHDVAMSKRSLLEAVSIENWILPCAYMGIINKIVWVCAPWCQQIPKGRHDFFIGEQKSTGKIRVTCTESYFISEGVVCKREELQNEKELSILVIDIGENDESRKLNEFAQIPDERIDDQTSVILDIDLDFFSTKNPFLDLYNRANLYAKLKELYVYEPVPDTLVGEAKVNFALKSCIKRTQLLDELEDIWQHLNDTGSLEEYSGPGLQHKERVNDIKDAIETHYEEEIDWMIVHNAGCTCDDTELPHHVSDWEEIDHLMCLSVKLLRSVLSLHRTKLITMARSSLDEFCPSEQVEIIQQKTIELLKGLFSNLNIEYGYLDD